MLGEVKLMDITNKNSHCSFPPSMIYTPHTAHSTTKLMRQNNRSDRHRHRKSYFFYKAKVFVATQLNGLGSTIYNERHINKMFDDTLLRNSFL